MGLRRFLVLSLLLAGPLALAQDERPAPHVPVWAPRAAFAGAYLSGLPVPQLRLGWEAALLDQPNDQVLALLEAGLGYGLAPFPADAGPSSNVRMNYLYQHPVLIGFGYRKDAESGLYWGFHAATGPLFTGARFDNAPGERRVHGVVEGRLSVGAHLGAAVYGVSVGYANLYQLPVKSLVAPYLGGFLLGAFANWR